MVLVLVRTVLVPSKSQGDERYARHNHAQLRHFLRVPLRIFQWWRRLHRERHKDSNLCEQQAHKESTNHSWTTQPRAQPAADSGGEEDREHEPRGLGWLA